MSFDIKAEYDKAQQFESLTWDQAVAAMRNGKYVRRKSDMFIKTIDSGGDFDVPVFESGTEAICLRVAVTDFGEFVSVFQGAETRCLFEPDEEAKVATDWVVIEDKRLI